MKTHSLALSAAALLFTAATAHATPSELAQYTDRTEPQVQVLLRQTVPDLRGRPISVRAAVDPDGRVSAIRVLRSSGSPDADHAVEGVLRKILRANPLLGLTDAAVTLNVGDAAIVQAKAP